MKKLFPLLFVVIFGLSACATDALKSITPQAPKVSLMNVKPTKIGLTSQQFAFKLNVANPNGFGLPISATDFTAKFNGIEVAKGVNADDVIYGWYLEAISVR